MPDGIADPVIHEIGEDGLLPGGHRVPKGYTYVGTLGSQDEEFRQVFEDLLPKHRIAVPTGVSAVIDRPMHSARHGRLIVRQIHDHSAQVHLHRKDDPKTETTYFVLQLASNQ